MTTLAIGPYEVLETLGQGGMGVVHLARHPETGALVALKTLSLAGGASVATQDRTSIVRGLRAEVAALERLRHPNIVRILNHGTADGVPWYAMELVTGITFAESLNDDVDSFATIVDAPPTAPMAPRTGPRAASDPDARTWTYRLDSAQVAELRRKFEAAAVERASPAPRPDDRTTALGRVGQVCHALAYMHGEGMVHCDLKPDNVLVTRGGRVVLVDFGLVGVVNARSGVDALAAAGTQAGTVGYMSPERLARKPLDARADLYAVGCLLYLVITGRPPFEGPPAAQVLAHFAQAPRPPSEFVDEVPAELEQLVLQLLAKDPADRPGHALSVVHVLEALGVDTRPPDAALPEVRPYLFDAGFAGREAETRPLQQLLQKTRRDKSGELAVLVGAPGFGKTRVAMDLIRSAREEMRDIIVCACQSGGGAPLHGFDGLLGRLADELVVSSAPALLEVMNGEAGPLLAPFEPRLAAYVGGRTSTASASDRGALVAAALIDVVDALTGGGAMMLVIEDLHWADALTLLGLRALVDAAQSRPWLILGVSRERLPDDLPATYVDVGPLQKGDVEDIATAMLGASPPAELLDFLWQRSTGVPLHVVEYLRNAMSEGLIALDDAGRWRVGEAALRRRKGELISAPSSVEQAVRRRIDELDGLELRVCTVAAALGRECDAETVSAIVGLDEDLVFGIAVNLARLAIFEPPSRRLVFTHDRIRQIAYDALEDREGTHALIAAFLAGRPNTPVSVRAWHIERSGARREAREAWIAAAEHAIRVGALADADLAYDAALALFDEDEPEGVRAQLTRMSTVWHYRGLQAQTREAAERCFESAMRIGSNDLAAFALLERAIAERYLGQNREAIATVDRAQPFAEKAENRRLPAAFHQLAGDLLVDLCEYDVADARYQAATDAWSAINDDLGLSGIHNCIGLCLLYRSAYGKAAWHFDTGLEHAAAATSRHRDGIIRMNRALLWLEVGRFVDAEAVFDACATERLQGGNLTGASFALVNRATALLGLGRTEEALRLVQQAIEIREAAGQRPQVGHALLVRGRVLLAVGRIEEAEADARTARAIFEDADRLRPLAYVALDLGLVALQRGEVDRALAHLEEAADRARAVSARNHLAQIAIVRSRALLDKGAVDDARVAVDEGLRIADELDNDLTRAAALVELARLLRKTGRPDLAQRNALRAMRLADALEAAELRCRSRLEASAVFGADDASARFLAEAQSIAGAAGLALDLSE